MPADHSRRRALQLTGAALAAAIGGCATLADEEGTPDESPTAPPSTTDTETATGTEITETATATEAETETADPPSTDEPTTTDSVEIVQPSVSFPDRAAIPDDPGRYQYATMGSSDAPTATVYGNWKCPHTRAFVLEQVDGIVEQFVDPGALALEFRFVAYRSGEPFLGPDAPRAARAGLSVWNADPAAYWSYLAYVFENQPDERLEWAQSDLLLRFAEHAGVGNRTQVERDIADNSYASATRANSEAAGELDVYSVPRVAAGGEVTAPTVDPSATVAQLERTIDS